MQLKINGFDYELNFGVRFVRELDKIAGINKGGISFGLGLTKSLPALKAYDPAVLSDVIYAATITAKKRPTHDQVDDFIDSTEDLDKIFKQTYDEMGQANAVKAAVKNLKA